MTNQVAITMLKNLEQSLDDYCELNDEGKEAFRMAITTLELFGNSEQLLSVQSELSNNSQKLDTENGELISRQDAIAEFNCCELTPDGGIDANYAIDFLEQLPSVQPQKGKWIRTRTIEHDGELYCNQCGQEHPEQKLIWNYCPNCGCRMEEGDSE